MIRKQLSAALDENNMKRGYVRASAPPSARYYAFYLLNGLFRNI
jgi:hypothetical protein